MKTCSLKQVSEPDESGMSKWYCGECGEAWEWASPEAVNLCPSCGAKITARWPLEGE